MESGLGIGPEHNPELAHVMRMKVQLEQDLSEEELRSRLKKESEPVPDPRERPDLEDGGDSEQHLAGDVGRSPFDLDWSAPHPFIFQLPSRARPDALFRIDPEFRVHGLVARRKKKTVGSDDQLKSTEQTTVFGHQAMIAGAIARHLRNHNCRLEKAGDWCDIPAIGSDDELRLLAANDDQQAAVTEFIAAEAALRKKNGDTPDNRGRRKDAFERLSPEFQAFDFALNEKGQRLKQFAIMLPNGEAVAVQALIDSAGKSEKKKKVTRAAALRMALAKPAEVNRESWTPKDWEAFEKAQRESAKRPSTTGGKSC